MFDSLLFNFFNKVGHFWTATVGHFSVAIYKHYGVDVIGTVLEGLTTKGTSLQFFNDPRQSPMWLKAIIYLLSYHSQ